MTSIVTLLCPNGIVVGTDMREITFYDDWLKIPPKVTDGVRKIYRTRNQTNVAIVCWGLAEIPINATAKMDIIPYLANFDKTKLGKGETVETIAEKLKATLESLNPPINRSMGCHVTGFVGEGLLKKPKLRHVFHADWHNPGEFTNEDCHSEYHTVYGNKICFRIKKDYPVLFNGDSLIANLLFNYARNIEGYYDIIPDRLSLDDCEGLAKMIIGTSIQRLDYFFDLRKFEQIKKAVGGGISIAKITEEGFEWVRRK